MEFKKTDNSCLAEKVLLRVNSLRQLDITDRPIKVLDAYAGTGKIWKQVQKESGLDILTLSIDVRDFDRPYLQGKNEKFLAGMDLSVFDIIDLDAYGSPFKQLEIVFSKGFSGIVHCTFIQTGMGRLDNKMLEALGYTPAMIKKTPTLFSRSGREKMENYLALRGVKKIQGYFLDRKNYFWFWTKK